MNWIKRKLQQWLCADTIKRLEQISAQRIDELEEIERKLDYIHRKYQLSEVGRLHDEVKEMISPEVE